MAAHLPGRGWLGWLGRQVGYVKKAIQTDIVPQKTVYKNQTVQEATLPDQPQVKLRRTTIDEVIVDKTLDQK